MDKTKTLELWYPVKPWLLSQNFGGNGEYYRAHGINVKGHNGIDIICNDGQIVRAAHAGVIGFTGEDGSGGLGVVVRTTEQFSYAGKPSYYKTIYWHLKKDSFKVKPGQNVKVGDILAEADNTGFSSGTHLHFGLKPVEQGERDSLWWNKVQDNGFMGAIDPAPYFNEYYAQDEQKVLGILQQQISLWEMIVEIYKKLKYGGNI